MSSHILFLKNKHKQLCSIINSSDQDALFKKKDGHTYISTREQLMKFHSDKGSKDIVYGIYSNVWEKLKNKLIQDKKDTLKQLKKIKGR